jgi:predicted metal-binding membrane protein
MSALELLLRRDRWLVIGALTVVVVLAWIYMLAGAGMSMAPMAWTPGYAMLVFLMWWIMMVAMMLPSASPVILLFANVSRRQQALGKPFVPAFFFLTGYIVVWGLFSLIATGAQWGLQASGQISMMAGSGSHLLGATILIAAGLWQLTPVKQACLRHCRSPLHFINHGFRPGVSGALRMGAEHGVFCLGCCWFLMGLLFYGGVMNIFWIAGLAIYVLIEKVAPNGLWIGRVAGVVLLVWGFWLLMFSIT